MKRRCTKDGFIAGVMQNLNKFNNNCKSQTHRTGASQHLLLDLCARGRDGVHFCRRVYCNVPR